MIALVVRKELISVLRDGRFLLLAISLFVVLAGLMLSALAEHRSTAQQRQLVGSTVQEQWENQGVKSPHGAAHFGIYVFPESSLLAALDPGISPYSGETIWVEPHKRNMARFSPAADASPSSRFAQLAPAFVLYALVPLLLIGLAFNAITHEKEQGTLRMLHSLGMSASGLLAGKLLGLLLVFSMVLLPPLILAAFLMLFSGGSITADLFARSLLLALAYLFYYAVLLALALALSGLFKSSRAALFGLTGVWIAFVLVMPRLGSAAADRFIVLPAAQAFWEAIAVDIAQGLDQDEDSQARAARIEAEILEEYGVSSIDELPVSFGALSRMARDDYSNLVHEVHFNALWERYRQQENLMRAAALFSPAIAMRSVSMKLSGTDLSHRQHFEDSAEQYRQYFNRFIDRWDAEHGQASDEAYQQLLRDVEQFQYSPPSVSFALRSSWPEIFLLLLWGMAAAALLRLAARKLQP